MHPDAAVELFSIKEGGPSPSKKEKGKKENKKEEKTEAKADKGKKGKKGGKKEPSGAATPSSPKKEKTQEVALPAHFHEIKSMYVFSKMSVINDVENKEEYTHMKFVEFLEMVCRLALKEEHRDPLHHSRKFNVSDSVFRYIDKLF